MGGCEEALLGAAQPAVLCTIYDGHCGRAAANEAAAALPGALAGRLRSAAAAAGLANGSGAGAAWDEAFHETDKALRAEEGCTATAVLAWLDAHGSVCLQVGCRSSCWSTWHSYMCVYWDSSPHHGTINFE